MYFLQWFFTSYMCEDCDLLKKMFEACQIQQFPFSPFFFFFFATSYELIRSNIYKYFFYLC